MNHFETIKYQSDQCKQRLLGDGGSRRSLRVAGNTSRQLNVGLSYEYSLEKETPTKPICLDLNSRKLRRYIIEDVMYMKPGEDFLLLVCDDSRDIYDWNKIIDEQANGLIKNYLAQNRTIRLMQVSLRMLVVIPLSIGNMIIIEWIIMYLVLVVRPFLFHSMNVMIQRVSS